MPRTRAIRILVVVICAGGIVGMIVTSATDHNGAAITFGLVTAVAIICQMVATTVVNELTGAPGAPIAGPWQTGAARPGMAVRSVAFATGAGGAGGAAGAAAVAAQPASPASHASPVASPPAAPPSVSPRPASPRPASPRPASPRPASPRAADTSAAEEDAAQVEERIAALVIGGTDETALRDLVRHAVRLGRHIAAAAPPDS